MDVGGVMVGRMLGSYGGVMLCRYDLGRCDCWKYVREVGMLGRCDCRGGRVDVREVIVARMLGGRVDVREV